MTAPTTLPDTSTRTRPVAMHRRHRGGVLAGCLITLGVLFLIVVVGVIYVAMNAGKWATAGGHALAVEMVNQSDMTQDDKNAIIAELDGLKAGVDSGEISMEDMGKVMEGLAESPLIPVAAMTFMEKQYIRPSGLSDEEKADAKLHIGRFARGVFNKNISQTAIEEVTAPISEPDPQNPGQTRLKEKATDEEIREFITRVKQHADDAEVSSEPFEVDIPAEFKKVIDKALNRGGAASESGDSAGDPTPAGESTGEDLEKALDKAASGASQEPAPAK